MGLRAGGLSARGLKQLAALSLGGLTIESATGGGGGGGSAPTITSVDLDLGDTAGGELRTWTGTGFTGATAASAGGTAVTAFSVVSDTELIVVMPAHAAATGQSLLVTTPSGTSAANTLYEFWSPAELSLTGFWDRGNYQDGTAGTWPGRASAGSSAGRDLTQGTTMAQPTEVGLEPVFDGVNDYLSGGALTMQTAMPNTAATIAVIFKADYAMADPGYGTYHVAPAFVAEMNSGSFNFSYTDSGVRLAMSNDVDIDGPVAAAPVGALHLAIGRWGGGTLGVSVDGGAEATAARSGPAAPWAYSMFVGSNYAPDDFLAASIRTLFTMDSRISDPDAAKLLKWAKACRGLPQ